MAQPLRGLAPQIPNVSLVWNLENGEIYSKRRNVKTRTKSPLCKGRWRSLLRQRGCSLAVSTNLDVGVQSLSLLPQAAPFAQGS